MTAEVQKLNEINQGFKTNSQTSSAEWRLSQYRKVKNPTTTGIVLMSIFEAEHFSNTGKGAGVTESERAKLALDLVESLENVLRLKEQEVHALLSFNPLLILSPAAIAEVPILFWFILIADYKVYKGTKTKIETLIKRAESKTNNPELLQRAAKLRDRLGDLKFLE